MNGYQGWVKYRAPLTVLIQVWSNEFSLSRPELANSNTFHLLHREIGLLKKSSYFLVVNSLHTSPCTPTCESYLWSSSCTKCIKWLRCWSTQYIKYIKWLRCWSTQYIKYSKWLRCTLWLVHQMHSSDLLYSPLLSCPSFIKQQQLGN